ncbi:hypothetical protein RHSIM_Rhsim03G0123700 [Rhododendron simsii]|uniref:Uncharacterized protein n=1 Tax=Rhododendron simsii TaxID=118357 RepID=A0A834LUL8_RHOSS|nr:hypothetical protein RHSIM_Rhsim03G0123700 [Rhododendron simsii]
MSASERANGGLVGVGKRLMEGNVVDRWLKVGARFWVTVAHLLSPVKLITTNNDADGANPLQNVERTFQLTRADMALLDNEEYEVQAWCILLNDKVPFRMQWPLFADLKVNGIPVRTVKRPGSQLLGANGRDDGPMAHSLRVSDPFSFMITISLLALLGISIPLPDWKLTSG